MWCNHAIPYYSSKPAPSFLLNFCYFKIFWGFFWHNKAYVNNTVSSGATYPSIIDYLIFKLHGVGVGGGICLQVCLHVNETEPDNVRGNNQ